MVSGASRGIGAVMGRAFAAAGADLVLAARSQAALDALAAELAGTGRRAIAVATDVTDAAALEALVGRTIEEFGRLDAVVNNAGGGFSGKAPIAEVSQEDFTSALELNLTGVVHHWRHPAARRRQLAQ